MVGSVAGFPGGGLVRQFRRILCVTGGIIGVWFAAALLTAGGGTAHAADLPVAPDPFAPVVTSTFEVAVEPPVEAPSAESVVAADGSLQATPSAVSESANRRAIIGRTVADARTSLAIADVTPAVVPVQHTEPSVPKSPAPLSLTPPAIPVGTPHGSADSAPSGAHLAVLAAALMAVVWLTQQLHSDAYRWRSVRVSTRIERPG